MERKNILKHEDIETIGWEPGDMGLISSVSRKTGKAVQVGCQLVNSQSLPVTPHTGLFAVVATVHDEDGGHYGKLVKYQTILGDIRLIYISNQSSKSNNAWMEMVDHGFHLEMEPEVTTKLHRLIRRRISDNFVPFAEKAGYCKAFHGFILPDGLYTSNGKKLVVYEDTSRELPLNLAGSYDVWKEQIAAEAVKYSLPTFALCVAFSSMLFPFVDIGTIFVHFYEESSKGKTLLLQLAASIYGNASDPRNAAAKSLISQWNATPAGLQGMAALYNGSIALLDELHKCADKDFPNAIYALCGGIEKTRAKSNGKLQQAKTWVFPGLSSGEQSGREKIARSKEEATLGRLIRFLDIKVVGQMFTGLNDFDAGALATELKSLCATHFGHAARDFMAKLLALAPDHEALQVMIQSEWQALYKELCPTDLARTEMRVMHHFALFALAGKLAVRFGILPMSEEAVMKSVAEVRDIWLEEMKGEAAKLAEEARKASAPDFVGMLKAAIIGGIHRFSTTDDAKPKANVLGYIQKSRTTGEPSYYLLKPETFEVIFDGHNLLAVCEYLCNKGVLVRGRNQYKKSHRIHSIIGKDGNSATQRLYTIKADILDDPEEPKLNTCEVPEQEYLAFQEWQKHQAA